jgi:hypothetical protein
MFSQEDGRLHNAASLAGDKLPSHVYRVCQFAGCGSGHLDLRFVTGYSLPGNIPTEDLLRNGVHGYETSCLIVC